MFFDNNRLTENISSKMSSLREKCPNTEIFLVRIFPYSDVFKEVLGVFKLYKLIQEKYKDVSLHKSGSSPLKISAVKVTQSLMENFIFMQRLLSGPINSLRALGPLITCIFFINVELINCLNVNCRNF